MTSNHSSALRALKEGEIIAYPTEGVWGLGCDPFLEKAVQAVRDLKKRALSKGMILLVKDWDQVHGLVDLRASIDWEPIRASWPGPVTWIFPASNAVPCYLQTKGTIALRMPSYALLQTLLTEFGKPLISTSANLSGEPAVKNRAEIRAQFPSIVLYPGECEGREKPSAIYDAVTGRNLR
jgi:L-threonylcarbamoyladenylate synthase